MTASPFILGTLAALVNNMLINNEDEKKRGNVKDPYGELPDYIRRNNLCIYLGEGKFFTVPLAIELRAFYGLGDLAAGTTVAPTAASPFIEWYANSDWKGAQIRRTGEWTENNPAWKNAYSGTPARLIALNRWVNATTNDVAPGNPDMKGNGFLDAATDPSMINHIIGTLGGGAMTTALRTGGVVEKLTGDNQSEIEWKDIPFLRSLGYIPNEQSSMARTKAKWYNYKDELKVEDSNYKALKSKNVPVAQRIKNLSDAYKFEQGDVWKKLHIMNDVEKQIKKWEKIKKRNEDDRDDVRNANQNISLIMQDAVNRMDVFSFFIGHIASVFTKLTPTSRVKTFVFYFTAVCAKWTRSARRWCLNLYTDMPYDKLSFG